MNEDRRIRVPWPPRADRRWCPGATRLPIVAPVKEQTGWTAFFRLQGVMERLREKHGAPAPLPETALD